MAELTALARAKPGSLSFASVGNGSPGHLAGELQAVRTGAKLTHIPYCGGGPAVPDFDVDSWYAMFVPARTPKAIIEPLNKALNSVLADPDIRDKLLAHGAESLGGTPEALGAVMAAELPRWAKLAKNANIKAE